MPARLSAQGSPPFATDDTGTLLKGQWGVDVGVSFERSKADDRAWSLPSLDLSYGLTDAVELAYGAAWVGLKPAGERARSGLGNSVAGVKWRFLDDGAGGLSFSVNPQVEFNTLASSHHRGLVEKGSVLVLPVQAAGSAGGFTFAANAGRTFHSRESGLRDGWQAGMAMGRKVGAAVFAGAELYGVADRKCRHGWMAFNVGVSAEMAEGLSLSAAAGRGLAGEDRPDYTLFMGIQIVR